MATGYIIKPVYDKGGAKVKYGFISKDKNAKYGDVFFHSSIYKGNNHDLIKGVEVEYDYKETNRGKEATRIEKVPTFLNPYNFVQVLKKDEQKLESNPLGKTFPIPNDAVYYKLHLYSGKISCRVKTDSRHPLFIGEVETDNKDNILTFFNTNKNQPDIDKNHYPVLPASSLKGCIRSVFEAATNSCMDVSNDRLTRRMGAGEKDFDAIPARIEKDADSKQWRLRLLPGEIELGSKRSNKQYGAWVKVANYKNKKNETASQDKNKTSDYAKRDTIINFCSFKNEEECYAIIRKEMEHPKKELYDRKGNVRRTLPSFNFSNVEYLNKNFDDCREYFNQKINEGKYNEDDYKIHKGWLYITNLNMKNKHDERFFYYKEGIDKAIILDFNKCPSVLEEFKLLMKDYKELHDEEWGKDKDAGKRTDKKVALSSFTHPEYEESPYDGQLVYILVSSNKQKISENDIKGLIPVPLSRFRYKYSPYELFSYTFKNNIKCNEFEQLCPACRVFGWVNDKNEQNDNGQLTAISGNVWFTHATLLENKAPKTENIKLEILASPKPTTGLFYLKNKNGNIEELIKQYDSEENYPCGRKFYRHHPDPKRKEYARLELGDMNIKAKNAIVDEVEFQFDVHFKNLRKAELGALLWSIQLEQGMYHRIGRAKPLGFGSVKMEVENVNVLNVEKRYCSLEDSGMDEIDKSEINNVIELFKKGMCDLYNRESFEELDNIKDLKQLLKGPLKEANIHYPRKKVEKSIEDKNYEWFMQAKEKKIKLPDTQEEKDPANWLKYI